MIRVMIVDDHEIVRRGLRETLSGENDIVLAAEAADGESALNHLRDKPGGYDVVLLDVQMDGKDGIDVLKQIRQEFPTQNVLMLSMYAEAHYAVQALRLGAAGYLNKCAATRELVRAIREVANSGHYITDSVARMLALSVSGAVDIPPHECLSHREYQTFMRLVAGVSLTEIAREMGISVKTVGEYRSRLLKKMNLGNNAALVQYAIQHRLFNANLPG